MVWTPFVPDVFATNSSVSATNMNKMGTQYTLATNTMEQDMVTPYVSSGLVCTQDGTHANQLDVTSGVAYLLQTDNTVARQALAASTTGEFTTSAFTSTYYLDLNPDASWSFATSHSAVANHLTICQVTTDGSGNISTVTDERTLNPTLLPNMSGVLNMPTVFGITTQHAVVVGSSLNVGGTVLSVAGKATAGNLGVPVIVAQLINFPITTTPLHVPLSVTLPVAGLYRISASFAVEGTVPATVTAKWVATNGNGGTGGATAGIYCTFPSGSGATPLNGQTIGNTGDWPLLPQTEYLAAATFSFDYQNSTATVNDHLSVVVELLAY